MFNGFYEDGKNFEGGLFVGDNKKQRDGAMWSLVANFLDDGGKVFVFNREGGVVAVPSKNITMACLKSEDFSRLVDKYLVFAENCKNYLLKKRFKSFDDYCKKFGQGKGKCVIVVPDLMSLLEGENGSQVLQKLILIERLKGFSGVSVVVCAESGIGDDVAGALCVGFQNRFVFSVSEDSLVKEFSFGKICSTKNLEDGESYCISPHDGIGRVVNFYTQNN